MPGNELQPTTPIGALDRPRLTERAAEYASRSAAENTRRAYKLDWAAWIRWCDVEGHSPLPAAPATIADHIAELAQQGKAVATINRRLACIATAHRLAGFDPPPTRDEHVRRTWDGIARAHGAPQRKARAVTVPELREIVTAIPGDLRGLRDRFLLVAGFAGALRRSELASLQAEDITETDEGLRVLLRRSKTDQHGKGTILGLSRGSNASTCPLRTWRAWRQAAGIADGPALRQIDRWGRLRARGITGDAVGQIISKRAEDAGIDGVTGHSLRAGFATTAARLGVPVWEIAGQTRHESLDTLRGYVREGELFTNNASAKVGL